MSVTTCGEIKVLTIWGGEGPASTLARRIIEAGEENGVRIVVNKAFSPEEAKEALKTFEPDLIICDGCIGFNDNKKSPCIYSDIRSWSRAVTVVIIGDEILIRPDIWNKLLIDRLSWTLRPDNPSAEPEGMAGFVMEIMGVG